MLHLGLVKHVLRHNLYQGCQAYALDTSNLLTESQHKTLIPGAGFNQDDQDGLARSLANKTFI